MSFLLNASKIWSVWDDNTTKYVRVKNQVINVTNKQVLLRAQSTIGPIENGLYHIGFNDELIPAKTFDVCYPDVDLLEPDFDNLKNLCALDKTIRYHMLEELRKMAQEGSYAELGATYLKSFSSSKSLIEYPFNVSPSLIMNARYLEIVLMAFQDFNILYLSREARPKAPLIVGINWGNCALITPYKTYDPKDSHGQYI